MALNALTITVSSGVIGRQFRSAVYGATAGNIVEVISGGTQGFGYSNGFLSHPSLPYDTSLGILRERNPLTGESKLTPFITTAVGAYAIGQQASVLVPNYRSYRTAAVVQSDGSLVWTLFVEDQAGAMTSVVIGAGATIILGTLALSGSLQIGTAASGTIIGATIGSTITANIPGIAVDGAARTYAGTPTGSAATIANGLIETLAGATNSPLSSSVTVSAAGASVQKLFQGGNPCGQNTDQTVNFWYDLAKSGAWMDQNRKQVMGLNSAMDVPDAAGLHHWSSSLDGSPVQDLEGNMTTSSTYSKLADQPTFKMSLAGVMDTAFVPAGVTALLYQLADAEDYYRDQDGSITLLIDMGVIIPAGKLTNGTTKTLTNFAVDTTIDGGAGRYYKVTYTGTSMKYLTLSRNSDTSWPVPLLPRPKIRRYADKDMATVPVGNPAEVKRMRSAASFLRMLDPTRVNSYVMGKGDTISAFSTYTQRSTDYIIPNLNSACTTAEFVAICNEAGVGVHHSFHARLDPSLWQAEINDLLQTEAPQGVISEHGNENWNGVFTLAQYAVRGVRAGLISPGCTSSANAVQETILWPYRHNSTVSFIAHAIGDKVLCGINGVGLNLFKAEKANPAGTPWPATWSNGAVYASGANVMTSAGSYGAIQAVPAGTALTNTAYWLPSTNPASGAAWTLVYNNTQCTTANRRYRAKISVAFWKVAKPRFDAANIPFWRIINHQGTISASDTSEIGEIALWDDCGAYVDEWMMAPYLGTFNMEAGQDSVDYTSSGPGYSLTDRQGLYRTDITADQAVLNTANAVMSTDSITYMTDRALLRFTTLQPALQAWLDSKPQFGGKKAINGAYEQGYQGIWSRSNWPDVGAKAYDATITYSGDSTLGSFCTVGVELFRSIAPTSGVPPRGGTGTLNAANWINVPRGVSGFQRITDLGNAIYANPGMYNLETMWATKYAGFANAYQGGVGHTHAYSMVGNMLNKPSDRFGWRTEEDGSSPAWRAIKDNQASVYFVGATVAPDAPVINSFAGSGVGQTFVMIAEGWNGGAAVTDRSIYRSTVDGFTPGSGNRIGAYDPATKYLDTTGTQGTTYYWRVGVTTAVGPTYSAQVAARPRSIVVPVNTIRPVASGATYQGGTVSFTTGTWTGAGITQYNFQVYRQIYRDDVATIELISTGSTTGAAYNYVLSVDDVSSVEITATVVAINAGGPSAEVRTSNAVGPITPPIVLATLTLANSAALATFAWSSDLVGAQASGSTFAATSSDGTALTVAGGKVSGTFSGAGTPTLTITETNAKATNTPKVSTATVTVTVSAYDTDAQSFFSAITNAGGADLSSGDKTAYNTMIAGLKADGIWALLDRLVWLRAAHEKAALIDIRNPAKISLAVGSPTFTPYGGYTGDGVAAYISLPDAMSLSTKFVRDSAFAFVIVDQANGTGQAYQAGNLGQSTQILTSTAANGFTGKLNSNGASANAPVTGRTGFFALNRVISTALTFWKDPATTTPALTSSTASTGVPSGNPYTLLRVNGNYSPDRTAGGGYGGGMTTAQIVALNGRLRQLGADLGHPLP